VYLCGVCTTKVSNVAGTCQKHENRALCDTFLPRDALLVEQGEVLLS